MIHYADVAHNEAVKALEFVRSQHDERLCDLAWWMKQSGGPIEQMDASLASLDLLAEWGPTFRESGMPGVPRDPETLSRRRFDFGSVRLRFADDDPAGTLDQLREQRRSALLHDAVGAYLFEVARRVEPRATWDFYDKHARIPMWHLHTPGIMFPKTGPDDALLIWQLPTFLVRDAYADPPVPLTPRQLFELRLAEWKPAEPQTPAPSILMRFLDRRPVPFDDREPVPDIQQGDGGRSLRRTPLDARLLVGRGADDLDPASLPVLSVETIEAGLRAAGFAVRAPGLVDGSSIEHLSGVVRATPHWHGDALKAVLLESIGYDGVEHFEALLLHRVGGGAHELATPTAFWLEREGQEQDPGHSPTLPRTRFPDGDVVAASGGSPWPDGLGRAWPLPLREIVRWATDVGFADTEPGSPWAEDCERVFASTSGTSKLRIIRTGDRTRALELHRGDEPRVFWTDTLARFLLLADDLGLSVYAADGTTIEPPAGRPPMRPLREIVPVLTDKWPNSGSVLIVAQATESLSRQELPAIDAQELSRLFTELGFATPEVPIDPGYFVDGARLVSLADSPRTAIIGAVGEVVRVVALTVPHAETDRWEVFAPFLNGVLSTHGLRAILPLRYPPDASLRKRLAGHLEIRSAIDAPSYSPMVLAFEPEDDDFATAQPLPAGRVAAALRRIGVKKADGEALKAVDLKIDAEFLSEDPVIVAGIAASGGRLRAVQIEMHGQTHSEWARVHQVMSDLADDLGAVFVPEGDLFDDL